ncbi:MAG TPA: iron-sulfur cluster assembly accessory protein [Actinomycetota bacterium]|jgi:iron-sulfur cluster assembly accessory protein
MTNERTTEATDDLASDVLDPIAVTDAAARKARALAAREGRPEAYLRLRVLAGGCSGFTYSLTFEDRPDERDTVVRAPDGFGVLIDPASIPIVAGSTLDFDGALMGGGLKVRNPRATHECACGDSFSI